MIGLVLDHGSGGYPYGTYITKKTNILAIALIFMASFQWCIMQSFFNENLTKWRTPTIMLSFIFIIVFLLIASLRTIRVFNIIYMAVTLELLTFGIGLLAVTFDIITLCLMIISSFFYFYFWIIYSAYFESLFQLNPFCFVTTFYLNLNLMVIMIYMQLPEYPKLMLSLGRLVILYTTTAMTIYHSVIVYRPIQSYSEVHYLRMGMLFFIDYVCIFLLAVIYMQNDTHMNINMHFCKSLRFQKGA